MKLDVDHVPDDQVQAAYHDALAAIDTVGLSQNVHATAMDRLMRQAPNPEFAGDLPSVIWACGRSLSDIEAWAFANTAASVGRDAVILVFGEDGRSGDLKDVTVLAVRGEDTYRWEGCRLWSPAKSGAALLVAPDGRRFAWDGRALISGPRKPASRMQAGFKRASKRLQDAVQVELATATRALWASGWRPTAVR